MMSRILFVLAMAASLAAGAAPADQAAAPAAAANPPGAASLPLAAAPLAAPVPAPPAPATTAVAAPPGPMAGPSAGNLLQTIFALCLVLGLLAALAWFMKRYGPKTASGSARLRIVGALNLGGRERIMVVEVGDQWIVVGAAPGRVNALATMPKQEGAEPAAVLSGQRPPASSFSEWLKQTIDKRNAK
jgi:flagellar protein FliO/FliZ